MTTVANSEHIVTSALKRVTTVATLPANALRIMQIADDPTSTEDALLELLEDDPPLAARV